MENQNKNIKMTSNKQGDDRLFSLYLARVATVDTRSTMRSDVSPLFEAALKEARIALKVFEEGKVV